MRVLGLLLLLVGIAMFVVHFMAIDVEFLNWVNNWGEGAAWGIRGGTTLVGLLLFMAGKKGDKKKK